MAATQPTRDEFGGLIGQGQVRTIRVPAALESVPRARKALVLDLGRRTLQEGVADESEMVLSELLANAIRHAPPLADGMIRVRWKVRDGVVEIEVTDGGGPTSPRPAPPALWTTSGRGLRIVRSLAHEWGVAADKLGVTVWAAVGGPSRRRAT